MAEVNIKTRLSLRYDTLANWNSANPVLNKGEVAVVAIIASATGENTYGQDTKPSILFKVGDGTSNFKALPYASARAADVYAWAKAATKPTYTASEVGAAEEDHFHTGDEIYISGQDSDTLEDWAEAIATNIDSRALSSDVYTKSQTYTKTEIDKAIEDMAGEIQGALESDTNTKYQIVFDSTNGLIKLQSKDIGETSWKDISGQSFDLTTLTVAKAKGISTVTAAGGNTQTTFRMPLINQDGNFVEGVSEYGLLGKGIIVEKGEIKPVIDANIKGNAATATRATSATVAEVATKDYKGNIIDEHYATKTELSNSSSNFQGLIQDLEGIAQTLEGYFTSEGVALEAVEATKDGAGNVIATTYATKAELAQDLDELDYESVGAAAASHTHTKSEITDFAHEHTSSDVKYEGSKISAASGKSIQVAIDTAYDQATTNANGLTTHKNDKNNPHGVTAAQVGLGNVLNVASYAKTETLSKTEIGTAIAAAEGRASEYAEDVVGTLRTAVTNGTVVAGKASKDGNGAVIADTYATKTEMNNVSAIANGKTKTFVTSKTNKDSSYNNSVFNTQNADVTVTASSKILLIDGTSHLVVSDLKLGDIILVKETDVPDRWVSAISSTSATLSKMETAKVDLTSYVLASTIINGKTLEDDIELTGDDIGIANDDGTSTTIADKFSEVDDYIDSFIDGSKVVGHAELADKATQDGDGNVIKDTYATKAALNTLGTAFESVEWALFKLTADGKVSIIDESSKINAKLNDYMSKMSTNDLTGAQIVERGLKFVMIDPTDVRWQGHISCFDINRGILSIKFECDSLDTISPYNGYDITIAYKSGVVINTILERRFNPGDVYILNGGNAAGAY